VAAASTGNGTATATTDNIAAATAATATATVEQFYLESFRYSRLSIAWTCAKKTGRCRIREHQSEHHYSFPQAPVMNKSKRLDTL
jgi:hypothetical protein